MTTRSEIEGTAPSVDDLKVDAGKHFASPTDVLTDTRLKDADKREILENWRHDAVRMAESAAENMLGGEQPPLQAINDALLMLAKIEEDAGIAAGHGSQH